MVAKKTSKAVHLECTVCKNRNYRFERTKTGKAPRLEAKKHCKYCQKHTLHKESH